MNRFSMKNALIKMIKFYQSQNLKSHYYCRHIPTCSEYSIIAIERYGALKGSFLSIKRILKCNPFGTSGIDLVKEKKEKL